MWVRILMWWVKSLVGEKGILAIEVDIAQYQSQRLWNEYNYTTRLKRIVTR